MATSFQLEIEPAWKYLSSTADHLSHTTRHCPDIPYISLSLPKSPSATACTGTNSTLIVRRLVFTTESHDQGYSDHTEDIGTYQGSFSFFEAQVFDQFGHDRVPRRAIQYNLHGSDKFRRHINVWDLEDDSRTRKGPGAANWTYKGLRLSQWLAAIRGGDSVRLVPRALYPGWTNIIRSGRIEAWFQYLHPSSNIPRPILFEKVIKRADDGYRPLRYTDREIRLVIIHPELKSSNENAVTSSNLRVSLCYTSLAHPNHIPYEALSYCWGDASETKVINLTDCEAGKHVREIHVRSNLFYALQSLRLADSPRIMWIDLLSINQTDLKERGEQVALMGEIFESAESVRVWLGVIDDDIAEDFAIIRSIASKYDEGLTMCGARMDHTSGVPVQTQIIKPIDSAMELQPRYPGHHQTHQVIAGPTYFLLENDRVFQRPWFQRVWVMQEVWSSSSGSETRRRPVTVHCGEEELRWEAIMQASHCIGKHMAFLNNYSASKLLTNLFTITRDKATSTLSCISSTRRDILSVFLSGLDLQATDLRDKLFALLIFAEETCGISKLPAEIRPDYTKSTAQVYADFTRWWIRHYSSLRILSAIHTVQGRSWLNTSPSRRGVSFQQQNHTQIGCPSWSVWPDGRASWSLGTLALNDVTCRYRACGTRTSVDNGLLSSPSVVGGTHHFPLKLALRGMRLSVVAEDPSPYPFFQRPPLPAGLQEAYIRIFDPLGERRTWANTRDWQNVEGEISGYDQEKLAQHFKAHWGAFPHSEVHVSEKDTEICQATSFPCSEKCMFQTQGGLQGLCPFGTIKNDLIVVLDGGNVPYLIRKTETEGEYFFVGECYVEGIMNGEIGDGICTSLAGGLEVFILV